MNASFSPDGTRIVTASADGTARVWDAASGAQVAILKGHEDWVVSASFSPDGTRIVTASADNTARVWDAASGAQADILKGHESSVESASFSPDGTRIVTVSQGNMARVWRVAKTPQELVHSARQRVPRCLAKEERELFALPPDPPSWCIEMGKWPYHAGAKDQ